MSLTYRLLRNASIYPPVGVLSDSEPPSQDRHDFVRVSGGYRFVPIIRFDLVSVLTGKPNTCEGTEE